MTTYSPPPNRTASRPPARPLGQQPPLSAKAQEAEVSANKLFEQNAVLFAVATDTTPALVHPSEIDELRRKFTLASSRLDVLTKLRMARLEFYHQQKTGAEPFDPLTPEQTADATAFFEKHGMRLKGERPQAPPNPIEARKAAEAPPAPVPTPAAVPESDRTGVRPPFVMPPPASLEIRFLTAEGFECALTLNAPSGVMVLEQGASARKKLVEQGSLAIPLPPPTIVNVTAAAAPAASGAGVDDDATPMCAIHKSPLKKRQGKNGSFWSCPTKLDDDTWCPYTYKPK